MTIDKSITLKGIVEKVYYNPTNDRIVIKLNTDLEFSFPRDLIPDLERYTSVKDLTPKLITSNTSYFLYWECIDLKLNMNYILFGRFQLNLLPEFPYS